MKSKITAEIRPTSPLLNQVSNFNTRKLWEMKVVEMIESAEKRQSFIGKAIADAKKDSWFGYIFRDNNHLPTGIVAGFGLANYLFEIYSRQIWIAEIMPIMGFDFPRPERVIEEMNGAQKAELKNWLKKEVYAGVMKSGIDLDLVRMEDVFIIKNKILNGKF